MSDSDVLRHAAAMGRAARKLGETESALRTLWAAWCEARSLDEAAARVGWTVALEEVSGPAATN